MKAPPDRCASRYHRRASRVGRLWLIGAIAGAFALPATRLDAQRTPAPSTRISGTGTETWVLLNGMMGGLYGMQKLDACLVARGKRVISIDAFAISIDSTDVTLAAMARRVDNQLAQYDVHHAIIVGHAHGGGIALRLAASFPERVQSLVLLDVGALPGTKTKVMGRSLGLVPIIAHMPFGKSLIRGKFESGIKENAGTNTWFDANARAAYVDPFLKDVGRAVAMAKRLSTAVEPEPVASVVERVHVPVTVVLGLAPHPAAPDSAEVKALGTPGDRLRIVRLPGVGHFPHEEATESVCTING